MSGNLVLGNLVGIYLYLQKEYLIFLVKLPFNWINIMTVQLNSQSNRNNI